MRPTRLLILLCVLLVSARAEVELIRVWPAYRSADSFVGIGEYFGRGEATAGRIILRTQPEQRGGYYWLIRLRNSASLDEVQIEVAVLRPGRAEPELHLLRTALPSGRPIVLAGLTGGDWGDPAERPVAWRVRVMDATGNVLAAEQSFLWSLPDRPIG